MMRSFKFDRLAPRIPQFLIHPNSPQALISDMKDFQDWLESDNVIKTAEDEYKTQDSQYNIPMTLLELKRYFVKEFTEHNLRPIKSEILEHIREEYDETDLIGLVDFAKHNYLDDGWEEEYENEDEAYQETGRGEAESEVRTDIEADILSRLGLPSGSLEGGYEFYNELVGEDVWETIQEVFDFLDA